MSGYQWLTRCCDRIEELQTHIKTNASTGKRSADVPWAWICKELFSLLSRYPTGVTNAIILSELQMLWTDGNTALWQDGECKKIGISDFIQSRSTNPEAILEGTLASLHDLPGTQIPLAWLQEGAEADSGARLEVYLHQKFYQHPQLQMSSRVRLTRCRLQQSQNAVSSRSRTDGARNARLLPTDIMVFLSDCDTLMMDGFSTQVCVDQQSGGYGLAVLFRVSQIGPVTTVHSPDGGTSQQVCVTLADDAGASIGMILWDEHLQLARLFKKGDWLGVEKPYYQVYGSEVFIEYGPATVCYCIPFVPCTASENAGDADSVLNHASILTDDEGIANMAAYPHRLPAVQVQTRAKAMTLCVQITAKSTLRVTQSNSGIEEFDLQVADQSGSAQLFIANNQSTMYHHFQPGQCVVVCGLASMEPLATDTRRLSWQSWRKGCAMWNVTRQTGWLASPMLCQLQPLSSLASQGCETCGVTVEAVASVATQPWCQRHATCEQEVEAHTDGFLWCAKCGCKDLIEESGRGKSPSDRPLESCWRWSFSFQLSLRDDADTVFQSSPTDDCAQNLLQTTASLFATLSHHQQVDLLDGLIGSKLIAFLSLCSGSDCALMNAFIPVDE